ncbi:hypothetical protein N7478_000802 [Penicillium angulare]|uniref:uncharacterized protein n=1 Tax=Penicillium angulare TaxID=116970 RepID=UPI0025426833|nr:uncharacterized protein N7478_000802 [Penicillium angulare]KAJ5291551.1 hypothetical protein N7478_000802 [Penicillium angulare]
MGRKLFFAQKDGLGRETQQKLAQNNGYVFGAHAARDSIRDLNRKIPKTKKMHFDAVELWNDFVTIWGIGGYKEGSVCATPDHALIKEFLRWYSHTAQGKKSKNGRPVMTSVVNCAERLFGGFEEKLRITIMKEDRSEIYNWIKRTLSEAEGTVENVEEPDHCFTKKDYLRMISSMWQADHRRFMPGLLKATIMLALQLYLFTGARIGAFIPPHEDKDKKGLRYQDIDLVLFPSTTAPWKVEWKVNQKWLKGNRNPDYAVFGIGIRDTKKPQFASGYLLLALALQHGALFGIKSVEDLAKYDLSSGKPIELRWRDEYLEKPVLRNVTAVGPQDVPLHKERFCELLRGIVTTAGYSKSITVHRIRKYLGSVIEGRYGSALVSQIYGHKDASTYPKEYLLHCSSIDTVSAVLGEEEQSSHGEYFQGFERFYEQGYPGELPAEIEANILQMPELIAISSRIEQLQALNSDKGSIAAEKLNYKKTLLRLRIAGLKGYQNRWVRERRDHRILNRGKEEPLISDNDVSTRAQFLLMPELANISSLMSSDKELSFDRMLAFVDDLKTLCERDFDVVYLPRESPVQGRCPAKDCLKRMDCLKKSDRSAHIHNCVQREIALGLQVPESRLKFCYECMEWLQEIQWRDHCSFHIQSWKTQCYEVIVYRHTIIRPGYCPFCLWNVNLDPEDRFHQWLKSGNLKQHIEEKHIGDEPICGCGQRFDNERSLRHHLHDTHRLNKAIWQNPRLPRKRKRTSKEDTCLPSMKRNSQIRKELRFYRYPPPRHEHEYQMSDNIFLPVHALHKFVEEHPERSYLSNLTSQPTESIRSTSFEPISSKATPPLNLWPITPGLEVIDPQILEIADSGQEHELRHYDLNYTSLNNSELSPDQRKVGNSPPGPAQISQVPVRPTAIEPTPEVDSNDFQGAHASNHYTEIERETCSHIPGQLRSPDTPEGGFGMKVMSLSGMKKSQCSFTSLIESEPTEKEPLGSNHPAFALGTEKNSTATDDHKIDRHAHQRICNNISLNVGDPNISHPGPLTRAQARQQRTQYCAVDENKKSLRKTLNAKEKRKMRVFKSQNHTLGQIASEFADIDTAILRQAWKEMKVPQRRTRSRAHGCN